jgi:hypothetical protein
MPYLLCGLPVYGSVAISMILQPARVNRISSLYHHLNIAGIAATMIQGEQCRLLIRPERGNKFNETFYAAHGLAVDFENHVSYFKTDPAQGASLIHPREDHALIR